MIHGSNVMAHTTLAEHAASWSKVLNEALDNGEDARAVSAAVMCAGLNIAAAVERAGITTSTK